MQAQGYRGRAQAKSPPKRWTTYRDVVVEGPPGLPKPSKQLKPLKKTKHLRDFEAAVRKSWKDLPPGFQEVMSNMGVVKPPADTAKPDLAAIVKAHLAQLPEEVRAQVSPILEPEKPPTEKSIAVKLKMTVGTIKDLTNKKAHLQLKVDQSKDQYNAQDDLKKTSEEYAKLAQTMKIEQEAEETCITRERMIEMMNSVGMTISEEQKEQLEKLAEETKQKRRKTGGDGSCG